MNNVNYKIPCYDFNQVYIEQTKRYFKTILLEHKSRVRYPITHNIQETSLKDHAESSAQTFNFDDKTILGIQKRLWGKNYPRNGQNKNIRTACFESPCVGGQKNLHKIGEGRENNVAIWRKKNHWTSPYQLIQKLKIQLRVHFRMLIQNNWISKEMLLLPKKRISFMVEPMKINEEHQLDL